MQGSSTDFYFVITVTVFLLSSLNLTTPLLSPKQNIKQRHNYKWLLIGNITNQNLHCFFVSITNQPIRVSLVQLLASHWSAVIVCLTRKLIHVSISWQKHAYRSCLCFVVFSFGAIISFSTVLMWIKCKSTLENDLS